MNQLFRLLFFLCLLQSGSFACTAAAQARPDSLPPRLHNATLSAETLIATGLMAHSHLLTQQQLIDLSLSRIDKGFDADYRYHLIDTLYQNKDYYILLLGQWFDFENRAWIASYAFPHQLLAFKQVFYDNAEGFLSIETRIKDNLITITTQNEYENGAARQKTEKYRFTADYKLHPTQKP